jgi:hypothetical protein
MALVRAVIDRLRSKQVIIPPLSVIERLSAEALMAGLIGGTINCKLIDRSVARSASAGCFDPSGNRNGVAYPAKTRFQSPSE